MLKVEDRFMIKDLHRRGVTISEIARVTGHDRKTIRCIVNGPVNPQPKNTKTRAKKIDPFLPYPGRGTCSRRGRRLARRVRVPIA